MLLFDAAAVQMLFPPGVWSVVLMMMVASLVDSKAASCAADDETLREMAAQTKHLLRITGCHSCSLGADVFEGRLWR